MSHLVHPVFWERGIPLKSKIFHYAIMILAIITLNFFLPRMLPGSPIATLAGEEAGQMTEDERDRLMSSYHLDKSLGEQFLIYLKNLVTFQWGNSYVKKQPIINLMLRALPWTLLLAGCNLILSTLIGTLLGAASAFLRKKRKDLPIVLILTLLSSLPVFWIGMVLLSTFGVKLNWFPIYGAYSMFQNNSWFAAIGDVLHHLALPLFTLVITSLMTFFTTSRYSVLKTINQDYVSMAHVRGIPKKRVQFCYVMRNALIPVFTVFMLDLGYILSGSVVVETVFSYPGLGSLMFQAVSGRDYPLMQYSFLVVSIMVIVMSFLADMLYKRIDPGLGVRNEK